MTGIQPLPPSAGALADALADALDDALERHTVEPWFGRVAGAAGAATDGFPQDVDRAWRPASPRPASVVYQARCVWTAATLERCRPGTAPGRRAFLGWAADGLDALFRRFVTEPAGGLAFWEGRPRETHLYAVSFGIFAAAAVARLTGSGAHRDRALRLFAWLDDGAWDPASASYAEALRGDGSPLEAHADRSVDLLGTPWRGRSSNALLHAVEALTELVAATGDARAADRLGALVDRTEALVVRDGARLFRYYDREWRPVDRTVSYGHDVETYHLVRTAREVLGRAPGTPTEGLARRALREGLTPEGGLRTGPPPRGWRRWVRPDAPRVWWAQSEALYTLAVLARDDPEGRPGHLADLHRLWRWIEAHLLDADDRGWFESVDARGRPVATAKAHAWKACYHETRGLLGAASALRTLSSTP